MDRLSSAGTRRGGRAAPGDTRHDHDHGDDNCAHPHNDSSTFASGALDLIGSLTHGQGSFGERLRAERLRRGYSQAQLAGPGMSNGYVSYLESGQRPPTANIVAYLAARLAMDPSMLACGDSSQARQDLADAVQYGQIALHNGEAAHAREQFLRALASPSLHAVPALAADARDGLALAIEATGDLATAAVLLAGLLDELDAAVAPDRYARLSMTLVRCHRDAGDLATATAVGDRALASLSGGDWTDAIVQLGATVMDAYRVAGDLAEAGRRAVWLAVRADELGSYAGRMAVVWNSALVARDRGEFPEAFAMADRALAMAGEGDDIRNLWRIRWVRARLLLAAYPERATEACDQLAETARAMSGTAVAITEQAWCVTDRADALLALGYPAEALAAADGALGLLHGTPVSTETANALTARADALLALRHRDDALIALGKASDTVRDVAASRRAAQSWARIADTYAAAGPDTEADQIRALRHAMDILKL